MLAPWADGPLVGRDDLLDELRSAAAEAASGSGSVVLLTGEAGIGKTSVARTLAGEVRDRLAVTWGNCVVDGSAPPFWPWRSVLTDRQADATATSTGSAAGPAIGEERFERLNESRDRLLARGRHRPLLHIIEDLQWADVASVLLLAHVTAAIGDAPILIVGTFRTGEALPRPLDNAIEEVRRAARLRAVGALGDRDVATLIRNTGVDPDPALTTVVQARTGGNPLLVTELLRAARTAEGPDARAEVLARSVPSRVSELVAHRVARLPAAVAELLALASVVGAEGDARTLASVRGTSVASIVDLLEQAGAAHLLDIGPAGRWQFRHQLIRDAVYAGVPATGRARHHAAVLEALQAEAGTPLPVIAHHALAAQPLFDAERAVALAARAGESAFAQHAYEEAVTWFERALAAAPSASAARWRAELLVLCGEAHRHIGEIDEARRAFVAAAGMTDEPALLARAALGYADPGADLGIAYRTDDAVTGELLERAIASQPGGDDVTTVLLESRLASVLYFSDEPGRARELATSAIARARRLDDDVALGTATAVFHDAFVIGQEPLEAQLAESGALLEWARRSGSTAARLTAHRARVFDLLSAGDLTSMDSEIVAFRRLAEPLRAPGYLWWPMLWSAMRSLLEGRHEDAESQALAAFETGAAPFPTLAFTNLSFLLFFLRREQGRFGEMEQATRDYAATYADIPALRVGLLFLLAEIGRVDEARGLLSGIDADALDRLHDRNWPASWFQLARVAYVVGERGLAATLLEPRHHPSERCVMVSLGTVCFGAAELATAWLHHTLGDQDAAADRYDAAEATNARIGARSWLTHARADHARLLVDRDGPGDREQAARLIELATETADAIGLASVQPVLDEVRRRLEEGGTDRADHSTQATFRHVGAVWELEFAGRAVTIPHARGLHDLAFLVARPDHAVSVLELAGETGTAPVGDRGAPTLDERARREIRARLHDLDAEEADAESAGDGERAAQAREARQALAEAVAGDLGLGGRSRRLGDPVERARKTVSTRIRRTIAQIGAAHPELGRHLERSVDTGAWCAYRPPDPVTWRT